MLNQLFKTKQPDSVPAEVWRHEYKQMAEALTDGYGATGVKFGGTDWAFLQNLKYNSATFNAFKCHKEAKEIHRLLTGEDGTVRTWKEFRQNAMPVCEKYNQRWLQTEFNHAHTAAKAARKWQDYQRSADLYPNLRYRAVRDERTRHSHKMLDGYVIPVNDPFWDKYYPPNDWSCRCSVQPTDDPVNMPPSIPGLPSLFQTNAGKTAQVFDTTHPYYTGTTKKEKDHIHAFVRQNVRPADDVRKSWDEYEALGMEWRKDYFNGGNGGWVATHQLRLKAAEVSKNEQQKYDKEAAMCRTFAEGGYRIEHQAEQPGVSSPDVLIDGKPADLKRVSSHNNIVKQAMKAVKKQGAKVVLFQFDEDTQKIHEEMDKLKRMGFKAYFFFTGREKDIYTI